MTEEKVKGCLKGRCDDIQGCSRCGWNEKEDARRKKIPLTLCEDGLRREIIPRKPHTAEVKEDWHE